MGSKKTRVRTPYGRILARKLTMAEGVAGGGAGRLLPTQSAGRTAQPAGTVVQPAGTAACNAPALSRQPPPGLAEARWVLVDFGGLFRFVWGPIFNLKDARTQVRYTVNQTKESLGKTGLRFDWSEFSKFDS